MTAAGHSCTRRPLAGSAPTVKALLEAGADPTWRTNYGKTPSQLAQSLGWDNVVALLNS
jgi:ankyrin repeat protein